MVYKFRSMAEPNLVYQTKDSDGDGVTVTFKNYNGVGLFETEETKIAEGLKADKNHGKLFYFGDPKKKLKRQAEIIEKAKGHHHKKKHPEPAPKPPQPTEPELKTPKTYKLKKKK